MRISWIRIPGARASLRHLQGSRGLLCTGCLRRLPHRGTVSRNDDPISTDEDTAGRPVAVPEVIST